MNIHHLRATLLRAALVAGSLAPLPALAQGLQVAPVTIELAAGQMTASLTVSNRLTDATGMQVRGFAWTQENGSDKLTPTSAIDVSPPIFEVPAGASQLVRLVLRRPAGRTEDAYRLLFDQLPAAGGNGVKLALRFSIPIFAEPGGNAAPNLDLRIQGDGGGAQLLAANRGTRHDRLISPSLSFPGGALGLVANTNYYVLAGAEQRWSLTGRVAALHAGMSVQLKAMSLSGPLDKAIAVSGP